MMIWVIFWNISHKYINLPDPSLHPIDKSLLSQPQLLTQNAPDLHKLLLPQLQLAHDLDDEVVEDLIEFEQQPSDSLEEADIVLMVGEDEIYDVLDELLILADCDLIVAVLFGEWVDLVEIEQMRFLMGELTLLVEVHVEVAKAI